MQKKEKTKMFASKAEEAVWWESNEEAAASAFEKAMNEGYVGPCIVVVTGDTTAARIRLGSRDVSRARVQAAERGLRYQTYLKMIIHEALRSAESTRKSANS
jgi:predicted DNA binding CopG/RHH family protein